MRIALFTDTYPPELNGVANSIFSLRNVLKQNENEVLVVTIDHRNKIYSYDTINKVIYISKKQLDSYNNLPSLYNSFINNLELIVKDFNPDVIHAQTGWGICSIATKISTNCDIPLVFTYLNMKKEYINYATGENIKGIRRFLVYKNRIDVIEKSNELITLNNKNKDYIRSLGFNKSINVIPISVDFTKFNSLDYKIIKNKKNELGINEFAKVFLIVSKLAEKKRIDILIKAYSNFKIAHPEVDSVLVIVGGGPSCAGLVKLVDKLHVKDSVKFIGSVKSNEISIFYRMSDIYLSASTNESQRLTYYEAIASRLLCLVRFDNDLLDIIKDNETGFYFHNDNDCASLIYKIINMKEEELETIKDKAIENIKKFSIEKYYSNIMHVYEKAIRKNW